MRDSPWFHQKRSESAPPVERVKDGPSITQKEQDDITSRISRPTESALYRQSMFWKMDTFMDRGFHSWSKMELFGDCKRCMWSRDGGIKKSCKIRPLNKSLPPLRSSRDETKSCQSYRGMKASSRASLDSGHGSGGHVNVGVIPLRGISRGGIYLRRENSDVRKQFGLQINGCDNGKMATDLAVPKLTSRPLAAVGQRV